MILALSWKNIWRSKRRSFVVVGAVILGLWALVFMIAFYNSFGEAFTRNAINYEYSHLQVHNPQYLVEPDLEDQLQNFDQLAVILDNDPLVEAYSGRIKINAMIGSAHSSTGIVIYGVLPLQESLTTHLKEQIQEGTYFEGNSKNPVLISTAMAEKLQVRLRSKVVLTFQDTANDLTAAAFRVVGLFESKSPAINEGIIYVVQSDLRNIVKVDAPHEIGILLKDAASLALMRSALSQHTVDTVRTYQEVAPQFSLLENSSAMTIRLLTVIIMLALLFGILNTMLMVVLERTREIGMLRSVGMHRRQIFGMIMLETVLLGAIGGPIGLGFGYLTVISLQHRGMDLSKYAEALQQYGAEATLYPFIATSTYWFLMFAVLITSFIGAIYPAIKAVNLNPLEAIRKH